MSLKYLYISLITIAFLMVGSTIKQDHQGNDYVLITVPKTYTAGDTIDLEFTYNGNSDVILYCSNSYGSIIIKPKLDKTLAFAIPENLSNKSGILNWQLRSTSALLSGQIKILPKPEIERIETYIGPPSIEAGGIDYTMLVSIPTDDLDNPLVDSTKVSVKHQFLDIETKDEIYTEHGFGYKNLYSYEKSGRILINTECMNLNSKEYDVNIVSAIPTNFSISTDRIHSYADGNQITTFKTSVIRDRFNNIVSDGTYVTFFITNKLGYKATTSGATIDGIATAKMLHPDQEDQWTIKAYIEGMANSESLILNYKQAISDFDVSFSKNNRSITIGPLQSFMDQYIPNGLSVVLKVYKDGILDDELTEQSIEGFANFKLKADRYLKGSYTIEIKAAGLSKSFPNLNYE